MKSVISILVLMLASFFVTGCGEFEEDTTSAEIPEPTAEATLQARSIREILEDRAQDIELDPAEYDRMRGFVDRVVRSVSTDSLVAVEAFLEELEALGVRANQISARVDDFQTMSDPAFDHLVAEVERLMVEDDRAHRNQTGPYAELSQPLFSCSVAVLTGILACEAAIIACELDVLDFKSACLNQVCPRGTTLSRDCCMGLVKSDLANCFLTCGVNGPDGDQAQCCLPNEPRAEVQPAVNRDR